MIDLAGCAVSAPINLGTLVKANAEVLQQWWLADLVLYISVHFFNGSIRFSGIIEYLLNSKVCRKKFEFVFQVSRKNVEPSLLAWL